MHHIMNRHKDFQNPLFPQCLHEHLEDRAWLQEGNDMISDIHFPSKEKIYKLYFISIKNCFLQMFTTFLGFLNLRFLFRILSGLNIEQCMCLGTLPAVKLEAIVTSKTLLTDMKKLSPGVQTSCLEAFHSLILTFAPKHTHFSYLGMTARYF